MLAFLLFGRLKALSDKLDAILAAVGAVVPNAVISSSANITQAGTFATVTGFSSTSLNGFSLASNVLTCTAPGVYEVQVNINVTTTASGGFFAYRLNGGAEVNVYFEASVTTVPRSVRFRLKLANNDALDFRVAGNSGTNITINGSTAPTMASLVRVSS